MEEDGCASHDQPGMCEEKFTSREIQLLPVKDYNEDGLKFVDHQLDTFR